MVKIQLDLSQRHDNIIRKTIERGIHKTKREVIRAAIEHYKGVILNDD